MAAINKAWPTKRKTFFLRFVLPLCAAHYRRKKTFADVDLVGVAVEPETINPLR